MDPVRRKRKAVSTLIGCDKRFVRLWFTKTNSYSPPVYINSPIFYKYNAAEKKEFQRGKTLFVKEGRTDIPAIILAVGEFEKLQDMDDILESLAEEGASTDTVVARIRSHQYAQVEMDLDDTDKDPDWVSSSSSTASHQSLEETTIFQMELNKVNALKKSVKGTSSTNCNQIPSAPVLGAESQSKRRMKSYSTPLSACQQIGSSSESVCTSGTKLSDSGASISHLLLAEMRLQTMILKRVLQMNENIHAQLVALNGVDTNDVIIDADRVIVAQDGTQFNIRELSSHNPSIFVRHFLRKKYETDFLKAHIIDPKGQTR